MFFTLIIPAYNCQETIDRLLISVVNQHYDDLKVIVIDDSDENRRCQNYIDEYKHKLNIEYYIRRDDLYTCHCPGNTRHDGLRRAFQEDTEYIFFADCDDEFFPDSLKQIYDLLKNDNFPEAIFTRSWSYNENTKETLDELTENNSWLHGKFYKKSFLLKNNIQFKIDLQSHEDTYFNCLLKVCLIGTESNYIGYNITIYKWYIREFSTSHHPLPEGTQYFELHFKDWLNAAIMPFQIGHQLFPDYSNFYIKQTILNFVLGYLYIQGLMYNNSNIILLKQNYQYYKETLINFMIKYNLTKQIIITIAYDFPEMYFINKKNAIFSTGHFIEEQSFRDFINDMHIYE